MPYTLEELEDLSQDEIMEVISELYGTTLSRSERTSLMRDALRSSHRRCRPEPP